MQFTIKPLSPEPDLAHVTGALLEADPSVVVDFDRNASALRLSTLLEPAEIGRALASAGLHVDADRIARVPSECCGGCGG